MKATAIIEGKFGRVEMSVDTQGVFKTSEGDTHVIAEVAKQAKDSYKLLNQGGNDDER